jgi:hypothetical protein
LCVRILHQDHRDDHTLPFLPLYVEQLGVTDHVAIVQMVQRGVWRGVLTAAIFAPLWGRLGDQYAVIDADPSKSRYGMAMSLIGLSQNIYQLGLRLLTGLLGGYSSGSTAHLATQTPRPNRMGGGEEGVRDQGGECGGSGCWRRAAAFDRDLDDILCSRRDHLRCVSGDGLSDQGGASPEAISGLPETRRLGCRTG